MEIKRRTEHNTTVLTLSGRLDSNTAPDFEKEIQDFLDKPSTHLILDFNDLEYISSAGLRVILNTAKVYRKEPFRFVTCAMQDHVQEVFEISGFDSFIAIYKSIDDSLHALEG